MTNCRHHVLLLIHENINDLFGLDKLPKDYTPRGPIMFYSQQLQWLPKSIRMNLWKLVHSYVWVLEGHEFWVQYTDTSNSASQVMLSLLWICWRSQHDKTCWICFVTLRSPKPWWPHYALDMIGKPSMSRGCTKWFCNV